MPFFCGLSRFLKGHLADSIADGSHATSWPERLPRRGNDASPWELRLLSRALLSCLIHSINIAFFVGPRQSSEELDGVARPMHAVAQEGAR
jgi:hypothetical protein